MSIFEQPDIRSNTKTGRMMRKTNLMPNGVLAVFAFVFSLGVGPMNAQARTFTMPACPIKANTIPPFTKTEIQFPTQNPVGETFNVVGTLQVTDQTSSTVFTVDYLAKADDTGVSYSRTVKQIAHETGSLTFDKGCTETDPYGSNACSWDWGQNVTEAYQGALQEDITAGKIIADLMVNNTPVQFTCPVCGGTCTIKQDQNQQGNQNQNEQGGNIWDLMTQIWFPLFLTTPLQSFLDQALTAAAP